ncbi:MAG TPA: hypothetical protein VEL07_05485 [Planctomycetota bacterium]|nr:hypothetical protein [Planctomycetota bacterium]
MPSTPAMHRRATVLIIVAGVAAMLAGITVAFLTRMRSDADENRQTQQEFQARIMLSAALQYVQETARLGWGAEAYGWTDRRTGASGPRDRFGVPLGAGSAFPAPGADAARCEAFVMRRPPFAISPRTALNPVLLDPARPWSEILGLTAFDPQPAVAREDDFEAGDRASRPGTSGRAWFRCWRMPATSPDGPHATFIVTCGAGATLGWRRFADAPPGTFPDQAAFDALRGAETILWYEVAWSAAVGAGVTNHYWVVGEDQRGWRLNAIGSPRQHSWRRPHSRQFGGTFASIRRLAGEPLPPLQW